MVSRLDRLALSTTQTAGDVGGVQAVSGIQKVHAIMGGFHLGPAPGDYLATVVSEIKKLDPDVLVPMHCSGLNFVTEAQKQTPGKVLVTTTGSRLIFGA